MNPQEYNFFDYRTYWTFPEKFIKELLYLSLTVTGEATQKIVDWRNDKVITIKKGETF